MIEVDINNDQELDLTLTPGRTSTGAPRVLDGPVSWRVEGNTIRLTVTDIQKGLVGLIQTVDDAEGDTTVFLEGDAKLGDEVQPLREEVVFHVKAAGADTLGVKAGEPRAKANPVPA